jgi:large subunit ribosomal protein L18
VRSRVQGTAERPRLAVFKSLKHIYAQVIDDQSGRTLVQASTLDGDVRSRVERGGPTLAAAKAVGATVAERAKASGIEAVVFDRGGYIYHGRVKALADAAREQGLRF